MIMNNTEALKNWIAIMLEPLCDADSSALARYVLSILKEEKPFEELKTMLIEQLDVFLAEETEPFVQLLFNVIGSEEYLTSDVSMPSTQNATESTPFWRRRRQESCIIKLKNMVKSHKILLN